jgi:hypothetical protein
VGQRANYVQDYDLRLGQALDQAQKYFAARWALSDPSVAKRALIPGMAIRSLYSR